MASNVTLRLRQEYLKTDAIWLDSDAYDETPREEFDRYEREMDDSNLMIHVHRDTGEVLSVILEQYHDEIEYAVKLLRAHPLPWVFTVKSLGVREKPLEDVLQAAWEKYRNVKLDWE